LRTLIKYRYQDTQLTTHKLTELTLQFLMFFFTDVNMQKWFIYG